MLGTAYLEQGKSCLEATVKHINVTMRIVVIAYSLQAADSLHIDRDVHSYVGFLQSVGRSYVHYKA